MKNSKRFHIARLQLALFFSRMSTFEWRHTKPHAVLLDFHE